MGWKDRIKDAAKGAVNEMKESYKRNQELKAKRREILSGLRMAHLKELAEEYNVGIYHNEFLKDASDIGDYVDYLTDANIPLKRLEEFALEKDMKKRRDLIGPQPSQAISIGTMKGNLIGNIVVNDSFNDFSTTIINSDLDFDLRTQALKYIEELKQELSKPDRDKGKIDSISKWFVNNKSELAAISVPFITKILSSI